jgi:hypothetical protein
MGDLVATAARGGFSPVILQFPPSNPAAWDLQRWPANSLRAPAARYSLAERLGLYCLDAPGPSAA